MAASHTAGDAIKARMKARAIILIVALCFAGAALGFADNAHIGTWKLKEAKSELSPGAPKNHTVVYEVSGDNVKVTVDSTNSDGKPTRNEWMFDTNPISSSIFAGRNQVFPKLPLRSSAPEALLNLKRSPVPQVLKYLITLNIGRYWTSSFNISPPPRSLPCQRFGSPPQ